MIILGAELSPGTTMAPSWIRVPLGAIQKYILLRGSSAEAPLPAVLHPGPVPASRWEHRKSAMTLTDTWSLHDPSKMGSLPQIMVIDPFLKGHGDSR